MSLTRVERRDVSRLGKFPRTGAGAVRVPATISRTGVQAYPEQGLKEYRPPEEVFAADSLASLASVPVTLGHPPVAVTPANAREYQIGHTTDAAPEARVKVDGSQAEWVKTTLIVADGQALVAIDADDASEVSCGYSCDLDFTPGTDPVTGEKYDAVQRNIRFNHVAILTKDQKARAGAEAKLRLDSKNMKIVVIDGVEYELGSEKHLNKLHADHASALGKEKARADKAEAERDAAKDSLEKAQKLSTDAAIDARVEQRFELLKKASKFLSGEYSTDGKSDHEIRVDALTAAIGADKIAGKSAEYISARFDGLCDEKPATEVAQYHRPTKQDVQGTRADGSEKLNLDNDDDFRKSLDAQLKEEK